MSFVSLSLFLSLRVCGCVCWEGIGVVEGGSVNLRNATSASKALITAWYLNSARRGWFSQWVGGLEGPVAGPVPVAVLVSLLEPVPEPVPEPVAVAVPVPDPLASPVPVPELSTSGGKTGMVGSISVVAVGPKPVLEPAPELSTGGGRAGMVGSIVIVAVVVVLGQ